MPEQPNANTPLGHQRALNTTVRPSMLALLGACFAFLFYGGWGYWINIAYSHEVALKVMFAQGSYSFVLTLTVSLLIESLFRFFRVIAKRFQWSQAKLQAMTIVVSCALAFSGSWLVNVFAQTPEIFKTVVLGYVFGGFYIYIYVRGYARRQQVPERSAQQVDLLG